MFYIKPEELTETIQLVQEYISKINNPSEVEVIVNSICDSFIRYGKISSKQDSMVARYYETRIREYDKRKKYGRKSQAYIELEKLNSMLEDSLYTKNKEAKLWEDRAIEFRGKAIEFRDLFIKSNTKFDLNSL